MYVTVAKVGQGRPKSNDYSSCLTSAKCERLYWTYQVELMRSLSVTSRRCSGTRNVAEFRGAPEIKGDFARLHLENGKSYE